MENAMVRNQGSKESSIISTSSKKGSFLATLFSRLNLRKVSNIDN
jgi:hypothetical protein